MATSAKMKKVAEDFGYQIAFLKSNNELWSIFNKAVNGGWSPTRFVAAVRGTKWYKTHSETVRTNTQLKYSDPASYREQLWNKTAAVTRAAREMGLDLSSSALNRMAEDAFTHGWSDEALRTQLAGNLAKHSNGMGQYGQVEDAINQTAWRNGVKVSDSYIKTWAKNVATGRSTIEDVQQSIRERYASTVAPGFATELKAGQDLYDLASPYMQTMAKTLEINPSDIDLFDPTVRKALASSSDKDGQVGSTPLWQFERDLKKDQRWLKTSGARDELDKTARSLGQMFGLGV